MTTVDLDQVHAAALETHAFRTAILTDGSTHLLGHVLEVSAEVLPGTPALSRQAILDELHDRAIADERGRRQRLVLTRGEVQVGDILDFELVTAITNTDPVTGQATSDVRVRYGQQWTPLYPAAEIVSVHRHLPDRHCADCGGLFPKLRADGTPDTFPRCSGCAF